MIRLDPGRYDEFKETYVNTVIDLIRRHSKNLYRNGRIPLNSGKKYLEQDMLHFRDELSLFRELVWYLNDYGLYACLTGEGTGFNLQSSLEDSEIERMDIQALTEALRPLILGRAETLIKAWKLLRDPVCSGTENTGFSHEIRNAMTGENEKKLKFRRKNHSLQLSADHIQDSELATYIPCSEERGVRGYYKKKTKPAKAIEEVCDLLEKRWRFLEYLYDYAYDKLRDKTPVCQNSLWKNETVSTCLVSLLELRSCPYCNRNYIGTVKGKNLGYQLDHFINKSTYPLFCLSLYNLVPSCNVCNGRKQDKDIWGILSPFEVCADYDHALYFHYVPPFLSGDGKGDLEILIKSSDAGMKERYASTLNIFDIFNSYKFNRTEAEAFIQKMICYPPSMVSELGRTISPSESTLLAEMHIEADMFKEGMEETDFYYRRPLSMMYRHLYRKYRE